MKSMYWIVLGQLLMTGLQAQEPPAISLADSARLFGKGTISTDALEFNSSFTPGGKTVFFSRATLNWGYISIFCAHAIGSHWSVPEPVPFTGTYRDTDPVVSPDGKTLYFASDRPLPGKPFTDYDYHLFTVRLKDGHVFSKPEWLPLPGELKALYPSVAASGNLYFTASSANDADIYLSKLVDGHYQEPVKLSFNDSKFIDFDPVVSSDEKFIVFTSNNRKGLGGPDLWVSFNEQGRWSAPVNMGPKVNTPGKEGAPGLSPDNKTLYFMSYREKSERPKIKGAVTAKKLDQIFHSTNNGISNIYRIAIDDLKPPAT